MTIDRRGRRASTSRAYLRPAMRRPNLTLVPGAFTRRVVRVDNGRPRATEALRTRERDIVRGRDWREIILPAAPSIRRSY